MTDRREVFDTMGTVASLTVEALDSDSIDIRPIRDVFEHYDTRFSLYQPWSELSRIASGELKLIDASAELREVYALALEWRESTHGDFTPHRPDGVLDLSGVVKALAIEGAGDELLGRGVANWCLNVGGDVLVGGRASGAGPWTVGIVDPQDRAGLLTSTTLVGSRRACATSGSAERGDHIWTVGGAPPVFVQATVVADDIVTADVLATAIISGGSEALDRACANWDIEAMTVDNDGNIRATSSFSARAASNS